MLSPADAALASRDQAICGLRTLLDDDAFTAALQTVLPHAGITAAQATYVRYKPGVNCLVTYRVSTARGQSYAYARALGGDLSARLAQARESRDRGGAPGAATLDDLGIVVYLWPHDRELKQLRSFVDGDQREQLMARFRPAQPLFGRSTLLDIRYKPERRYVGQLTGSGGEQALLKLYGERDYQRASVAARAFRSHGPLRVARRIARSGWRRALLFAWLPGEPLRELLEDASQSLERLAMAGAALAELHRQQPEELARLERPDQAAAIEAAATAVGVVFPDLAGHAEQLAKVLAAELRAVPAHARPVHGDFYADQVLLGEADVALLDLDNAAYGDPCADLGTFAAHLRRDALRDHWTMERAEQALEALLEGYGTSRVADAPLRLYTAAGLLRLAAEPFRYREPGWSRQIERLVEAAEATMAGHYVDL